MASGDVKLIGSWASPFVIRARIALNLKGVDYEFLQETIGSKSDLLLKSNPVYKKIPVLLHGDKSILESMIIVNYIDDAWPSSGPAILPSNPLDRATARFWAVYIDDKWFPAVMGVMMGPTEEAKVESVEQVTAGLLLLEEVFQKCGKGSARFFNGETIGYLDIAFGSNLGWLKVIENLTGTKLFDEAKTPLLAGWVDRFYADEAVKEVMPDTDKLIEFAKLLFATRK